MSIILNPLIDPKPNGPGGGMKASTKSVVGLLDGYGVQLILTATTKPKNHHFWLTGATRGWLYEPVVLIQGRTLLLLPRRSC